MRVIITACVCLLVLAGSATAQVEKGDKEVSFSGSYAATTGTDLSVAFGFVDIQIGQFVTNNLQVGGGPNVSFFKFEDETETTVGSTAYFNYNFQTGGKQIPFLRLTWYQWDWSPDEGQSFSDFSFVTAGGGLRSFLNDYAALNTSLVYGFPVASDAEGGLIMLNTALSFVF